MSLLNDLTRLDVEEMADSAAIFARGSKLFAEGAVRKLTIELGRLQARVRGTTDLYQVEIEAEQDELVVDCTCLYDGEVCKHSVAVLLQFLNDRANGLSEPSPVANDNLLQRSLESQSHAQLVGLLLKLAQDETNRHKILANISIPAEVVQRQPRDSQQVRQLNRRISQYFQRLPHELDEYYESEPLPEIEAFIDESKLINSGDRLMVLEHLLEAGNAVLEEYEIDTSQFGDALVEYGEAAALLDLNASDKQVHFNYLLASWDNLQIWDYGADPDDLKEALDTLASQPEDYQYLLTKLKGFSYDGATDWRADYYLKLGDEESYLRLRRSRMETEAHFLELADFYQNKGQIAESITTLENWLKRRDNLAATGTPFYSYSRPGKTEDGQDALNRLADYYRQTDNDRHLLRILLAQVRHKTPSLELYQRIKEVGQRLGNWADTRPAFESLIKASGDELKAEIYIYEQEWDRALEIAHTTTNYNSQTVRSMIAGRVREARPREAALIYQELTDINIKGGSRKYYEIAASYAQRMKEIYLQNLHDHAGWQTYLNNIQTVNKRRYAVLEEFSKL